MLLLNFFVLMACLIGLVGTIIQIYPGLLIVVGAIAIWGFTTGGSWGIGLAVGSILFFLIVTVGEYLLAGKYLKSAEVSKMALLLGSGAGCIGFFLIPIVGLFIGFVAGVYLVEWRRTNSAVHAWSAAIAAVKSVGLIILIELFAALTLIALWVFSLILGY